MLCDLAVFHVEDVEGNQRRGAEDIGVLIGVVGDHEIAVGRSFLTGSEGHPAAPPDTANTVGDVTVHSYRGASLSNGTYIIEEDLDAEASTQMVITLPDHDTVFTGDLVFTGTHLFLTRDLDNWIFILEELRLDSPANVLPGHGSPAGPGVYAENVKYLRTAQANLSRATSSEQQRAVQGCDDLRLPELAGTGPHRLLRS